MVARHVAEQQIVLTGVPQRALGEDAAACQLLEVEGAANDAFETRVADLHAAHCFVPDWAAFFCSSLTRV